MAKTKKELLDLKKEYETLNNKLKELSDDELSQIASGVVYNDCPHGGDGIYYYCKNPKKNIDELACQFCFAYQFAGVRRDTGVWKK